MIKPQKRPRPLTTIAKHSSHLKAIGMFIAEFNVLELALGDLLGSVLHIDTDTAQILYLTPHTGTGRLRILQNLATDGKRLFKTDSDAQKELIGFIKKAVALMGKRHNLIHDSWGLASNKVETVVARREMPFLEKKEIKPTRLQDLHKLIADVRNLTRHARDMTKLNYESWPPYASKPRPEQPAPRARSRARSDPQESK